MTVAELIKNLQTQPQDAEVFHGETETLKSSDGLPVLSLFDFVPVYYEKLRSCKSGLPSSNSIKQNVVVFEYD